ncbi:hypothetical protein [Siminovitchia sp. 179-K 8D1 HS]|uniref:hypothetical protein n=1 Tax=Siminovitchia sp. 179-K 8D1 HS TaxID=3142385 RepID=UPI0039A365D0
MDVEAKNNQQLRRLVINLGYEISGLIDHGEYFYDLEELNDFCATLDKLKNAAREYYISNQEEIDE